MDGKVVHLTFGLGPVSEESASTRGSGHLLFIQADIQDCKMRLEHGVRESGGLRGHERRGMFSTTAGGGRMFHIPMERFGETCRP